MNFFQNLKILLKIDYVTKRLSVLVILSIKYNVSQNLNTKLNQQFCI